MRHVGWPGGSGEYHVRFSRPLAYWAYFSSTEGRYWSIFGVGEPRAGVSNSIVCEINAPFSGIRRNVAGVFLEEDGKLYLGHRGRIGGGRKGIGRSLFEAKFSGKWETVQDGDRDTEIALIGRLGPALPQDVGDFVHAVDAMKRGRRKEGRLPRDFRLAREFADKVRYKTAVDREATFLDGRVVNAMMDRLTQQGFRVFNDKRRDVCVALRGEGTVLYEVKTDFSTQSIYTGVGQLVLNGAAFKRCAKVLVRPRGMAPEVRGAIEDLGIRVLEYRWKSGEPNFLGRLG